MGTFTRKLKPWCSENGGLGSGVCGGGAVRSLDSGSSDSDTRSEPYRWIRQFSDQRRVDTGTRGYLLCSHLHLFASYWRPHVHGVLVIPPLPPVSICFTFCHLTCLWFPSVCGNGVSSILQAQHLIFISSPDCLMNAAIISVLFSDYFSCIWIAISGCISIMFLRTASLWLPNGIVMLYEPVLASASPLLHLQSLSLQKLMNVWFQKPCSCWEVSRSGQNSYGCHV